MAKSCQDLSLLPFYCAFLFILILPADALLHRTPGPANDARFSVPAAACNASSPYMWQFGNCSQLISCMFNNLNDTALSESLSIGTSIAALTPTILALIGSPPLELVQLGLLSPHRALATCCFSIGLPSGLFRQLRPLHSSLSQSNPLEPRIREWTVPLPAPFRRAWHNWLLKVTVDVVILALACFMVWWNWGVNSYTMVPWRCEYSYLLFAWPIACMFWLAITLGLLHIMKESAEVFHANTPSQPYSIWKLMTLPYRFGPDRFRKFDTKLDLSPLPSSIYNQGSKSTASVTAVVSSVTQNPSANTQMDHRQPRSLLEPTSSMPRSDTIATYGQDYVTVRIVMKSNFGLRSWRCFETCIESLAVGIYLYATFTLTSSLFLNADKAIAYLTILSISLSAIRILEQLF